MIIVDEFVNEWVEHKVDSAPYDDPFSSNLFALGCAQGRLAVILAKVRDADPELFAKLIEGMKQGKFEG